MTTSTLHGSVAARLRHRLKEILGTQRYVIWLGQSARLEYSENDHTLSLTLPHRFALEGVQKHCGDALRQALDEAVGPHAQLAYHVDGSHFEHVSAASPAPAAPPSRPRTAPDRRLRRLDDFIVGPSNELAYAAAAQLAEEDAEATSLGHPLFIHGGCGLGKTHLLQGICHRVLTVRPHARVRYTTGEQFTNEYIQAVRTGTLDRFRTQLRRLDLLAVDDVHFLAAKEKTQQEFLHTFDRIDLVGARVVLASDCHPRMIKQLSESLVSRCVRGLVVQINAPDAQTRRALAQRLAVRRGLDLSASALEALTSKCDGSVRDIEGLITKLHAMVTLTDKAPRGQVGVAAVERLLDHEVGRTPRKPVRFDAILAAVTDYFGLTSRQVLGNGRSRLSVLARSVLIRLTRDLTPMSYPEIAAQMGRKSHSTVVTAAGRVQQQVASGQQVLVPGGGPMTVEQLLADVKGRVAR